jgi:hypothetical protein
MEDIICSPYLVIMFHTKYSLFLLFKITYIVLLFLYLRHIIFSDGCEHTSPTCQLWLSPMWNPPELSLRSCTTWPTLRTSPRQCSDTQTNISVLTREILTACPLHTSHQLAALIQP